MKAECGEGELLLRLQKRPGDLLRLLSRYCFESENGIPDLAIERMIKIEICYCYYCGSLDNHVSERPLGW